ncbi:MAG: sirohydrochlorin cobaltochelatase [Ruminococcus sp.]|nr:sirohydrochlorin cobaltochelatase [Ruminococcus sp.]
MTVKGININSEEMKEKSVILVVSFGTSCMRSRANALGAIENAVADAFTDYEVRRAFTSSAVISAVRKNEGEEIDHFEQALDRLVREGVKRLAVQPTYIICGNEYDKLTETVESCKDKFDAVSIGEPLLSADDDYIKLVNALAEEVAEYSGGETAIVFMGHGMKNRTAAHYIKLQNVFARTGRTNWFVGTMNAVPDLDDVIASLKAGSYKKAVLLPLMAAAGVHAEKDMAGDKADSWKSLLEAEGFEVECILKGLGEMKGVRDIYVSHARDSVIRLNR